LKIPLENRGRVAVTPLLEATTEGKEVIGLDQWRVSKPRILPLGYIFIANSRFTRLALAFAFTMACEAIP
jgi:hypothetical protein